MVTCNLSLGISVSLPVSRQADAALRRDGYARSCSGGLNGSLTIYSTGNCFVQLFFLHKIYKYYCHQF
jgi:hypothetical protein